MLLTPSSRSQVRSLTLSIDEDNFLGVSIDFLISAENNLEFIKQQGAEEVV